MKKPLFILTLAAAVSPMLDAKVYSCGPGCYSDSAKGSRGYANLGKQIGSYTLKSYADKEAVAAEKSAPPPVQHALAESRVKVNKVPRPAMMQASLKRVPSPAAAMPAMVQKKANPAKMSGRRSILEQELDNERQALAQAQRALAEGRVVVGGKSDQSHQSRVRQLESAVLDRQQNIQALQRELSRM